jgi:hypothetical protein
LTRLQSAIDDLARALERDRHAGPLVLDRPAAGWPAAPRGLGSPRRLSSVAFPRARV